MKNNSLNLVFIVDDDSDDRQIILDALLEINPDITYVFIESGADLIAKLYSHEYEYPALVLLDLNMPGMLGLQALREIKSNKSFSHIPVVVLTTSTLHTDRKSAYEAGANCFVKKPDSYSKLVSLTASIIQLWLPES
jgi:CheY-like chemotaxis protein